MSSYWVQFSPSHSHVSLKRAFASPAPPNSTTRLRARSKTIATFARADGPISCFCVHRSCAMEYRAPFPKRHVFLVAAYTATSCPPQWRSSTTRPAPGLGSCRLGILTGRRSALRRLQRNAECRARVRVGSDPSNAADVGGGAEGGFRADEAVLARATKGTSEGQVASEVRPHLEKAEDTPLNSAAFIGTLRSSSRRDQTAYTGTSGS